MAEVGSAFVSILPSAKGFGSKLDSQVGGEVKSSGGRMGKVFGGAMKVGLVAAGAGLVAVGAAFKGAIAAAAESERITAATAAVLKSTGGAANVTADQVNKLGNEISAYSGIADESVREGQNLLLTFTKVRNEAGKGNDVFTQATKSIADMSVALGTDMKGAALQVGKALNDPTKGVSALSRAGVSFTQQQKDQIKAMQESGNMLGAQKLILSELETQFGGAAKAAGDTFTGSINKLKNAFGDTLRDAVAPMLPKLTEFALLIAERLPGALNTGISFFKGLFDVFGQVKAGIQGVISSFGGEGGGGLMAAFQGIGAFITGSVVPAFMGIMAAIQGWAAVALPIVQAFVAGMRARIEPMLPTIRVIFTQIGSVITGVMGLIQAVIQRVTAIIGGIWSRWGTQIMDFAAKAFGGALTIITGVLRVIQGVIKTVTSIIKGDWSGAWNGIKVILSGVWTAMKGIVSLALTVINGAIRAAWAAVKALTSAAWDGIKAAVKAGINKVISDVKALPGKAKAALGDLGTVLYDAGVSLIKGLIDGIGDMIKPLTDKLGFITDLIPKNKGPESKDKALLRPAGQSIMQGLIDGLTDRLSDLRSTLSSITDTVASAFTSDAFGGSMQDFFATLRGDLHKLGDAKFALGEFRALGLSKAFIESLMESGNSELLRSLAFDPGAARRADRLFQKRASLAGDLGSATGQSVVGQEVRGVRTELRELRKDVKALAKDIGRELNGAGATAQRRRTA